MSEPVGEPKPVVHCTTACASKNWAFLDMPQDMRQPEIRQRSIHQWARNCLWCCFSCSSGFFLLHVSAVQVIRNKLNWDDISNNAICVFLPFFWHCSFLHFCLPSFLFIYCLDCVCCFRLVWNCFPKLALQWCMGKGQKNSSPVHSRKKVGSWDPGSRSVFSLN